MSDPISSLSLLARWYAANCNGEWEHHHGISITSTDNPGWWIKVGLRGTALAERSFEPVAEGLDAAGFPAQLRWLHCCVRGDEWHGAGDETRLEELVNRFLRWSGSRE
jgi:hypothetical protein